jgi:CDP-diacylglycerol--glycerol-3-phosphate 3-phosphatidyltransferase
MRGLVLDNQKSRGIAAHIIDPVARGLLRVGVKPNHVTVVTALAVSIIVLMTWSQGYFLLGMALVLPFTIGDLLDGTMARLSGSTSALGGFLDSVLDRVTDAALVGSLLWWSISTSQDPLVIFTGIVAIATGGIVPYIRAKAEALNVECKVGIMERGERALVVGIAVIVAGFGFLAAIEIAFIILAFFNSVTVIQRIAVVAKALR